MKEFNCVLLVDDDLVSCYINERILTIHKVTSHTHTARNGNEALKFVETNLLEHVPCPDLILLDLNMPVMNGFEFLESFYSMAFDDARKPEIVVVTSSSNPKDRTKAETFPILGYLNKPLNFDDLLPILGS